MNTAVVCARIRQWYTRPDDGEAAESVGCETGSGALEAQMPDGGVDEVDFAAWLVCRSDSGSLRKTGPDPWTARIE